MNQLDIDCREAQDQGHEFHFSWLLILIAFVAWELLEGTTFSDLEPFEQLAAKFNDNQMSFSMYIIIRPKLFLVLINVCYNIYEMVVRVELHQRSKPM